MVDLDHNLDPHMRKFLELLPQAWGTPELWTAWDTYIDQQPPAVADELRRRPDVEAADLVMRLLLAIADQVRDGTPLPADLESDLRRPGRAKFEGDREQVADLTRSLAEDVLARGAALHKS